MTTQSEAKHAPSGARFIDVLTEAVKTLSLLYAGTPDDLARASLDSYVAKITPDIGEAVGPDTAANILEAFAATVMGEKHRIERGCA
ncbi:hypothetical protein [Bradyrhizobium sp. 6(2017)]|uniref:hypothetical protein n=1 Tax=Bradyrhizobium sp. 6(2017) TaxID=1197460 RepID=UPI0013E1C601|nr:hypothetical protein [Bradyrhizobium sp. 6(2017)]QIG94422.1 hypothetical protein G6P99_19370 [Bradyrhizobium sp. 6(2017)]